MAKSELDKFKDLINKDVAMMNKLEDTKATVVKTLEKQLDDSDFVDCEVIEEDPTHEKIKNQIDAINNSSELSDTFNQLFDDMNKKYGLNIKFGTLNQSLLNVIDPRAKKAMELYLSETYGRFRVAFYTQVLTAIAQLSAQVFDPEYLTSSSISYPDKLETMERLFGFVNQVNEIYDQVNIDNADMKLDIMKEDKDEQFDMSNKDIKNIMADYVKKSRENNK